MSFCVYRFMCSRESMSTACLGILRTLCIFSEVSLTFVTTNTTPIWSIYNDIEIISMRTTSYLCHVMQTKSLLLLFLFVFFIISGESLSLTQCRGWGLIYMQAHFICIFIHSNQCLTQWIFLASSTFLHSWMCIKTVITLSFFTGIQPSVYGFEFS